MTLTGRLGHLGPTLMGLWCFGAGVLGGSTNTALDTAIGIDVGRNRPNRPNRMAVLSLPLPPCATQTTLLPRSEGLDRNGRDEGGSANLSAIWSPSIQRPYQRRPNERHTRGSHIAAAARVFAGEIRGPSPRLPAKWVLRYHFRGVGYRHRRGFLRVGI